MNRLLTVEEAYDAMAIFIRGFYERDGKPANLALLLSGMMLLDIHTTGDPAYWDDWMEAIDKATSQKK